TARRVDARDDRRRRALLARGLDVLLEVGLVRREGAGAGGLVLLVVVAELDEEVIAGLVRSENLVEPAFAAKAIERAAGFGVVAYRDVIREEPREHLRP